MKTTGIVRSVDTEGRVSIPIKLRRELKITQLTSFEILVDGDNILLKKHSPRAESVVCEGG